MCRWRTDQIGKVVACLAAPDAVRQAETDDVLHVGVQARRVGTQHHIDQGWQEVVCTCWLAAGWGQHLEDILAASRDTGQLVLRCTLRIHFNDGCRHTDKHATYFFSFYSRNTAYNAGIANCIQSLYTCTKQLGKTFKTELVIFIQNPIPVMACR